MSVLTIASLGLLGILGAQDPDVRADRPAPVLQPPIPSIELVGEERPAPPDGRIERNGHLGDRFTEEGQRVRYAFDAGAGEVSIFDVGTWGYSRGWRSRAALRILDAEGSELVAQRRPGGTTSRLFQHFEAPADGTYVLELSADEQYFRYTVVRHSGYAARRPGESRTILERGPSFGFLPGPRAVDLWRVPVKAGESIALRIRPTHPQAQELARQARAAAPLKLIEGERLVPGLDPAERRASAEGATRRDLRRAQGMAFPGLVIDIVTADGTPIATDGHYHLWRPEADGEVDVSVRIFEGATGVLYELGLQRDVPLSRVTGYVGDRDDEPVPGIEVHLIAEDRVDHLASAVSGADGEWSTEVPPGRYSVLLRRPEGKLETVHVVVEEEGTTEVNTIYEH